MIYKALLWTDVFWLSYIKWYKFYNNKLLVILRSQQAGTLKLGNSKHKDWASIQLLTLYLNFLDYFAEMSSYFSMSTNKREVRKCLRCVKEFSHRFDLANGKYLSIFLGVFARIIKAKHFAKHFANFTWKNWKQKILLDFLYKTKSCVTCVRKSVCNAGIPSTYLPKQMHI